MDKEIQDVIEFYHGYMVALMDVCMHSNDLDEDTMYDLLHRAITQMLQDIERKRLIKKIKNE
ncbi:MAG: hypothetical protein OCU22_10140 [Canidatus Methanoxibalbensis ujae]|nr:hypothetical protein [Candidatus Methanoxibalbensis ujae]